MSRQPERMRVVGVSGSLRTRSRTRPVLEQLLELLETKGTPGRVLDLATARLPLFSGYNYPESDQRAIDRFRADVAASDAVILASPEYHGTLGGGLKNALDLLPDGSLHGKAVGLVAVAGGALSPVGAAAGLRAVVRALGGVALPRELLVSRVKAVTDERGRLAEPDLLRRADRFAEDLVTLAERLNPRAAPLGVGLEVGV